MKKWFLVLFTFSASINHQCMGFDYQSFSLLAIAAASPFYYRLFLKEPIPHPPEEYTLDTKKKNFWDKKNLWRIADQLIVGQRSKTGTPPCNPTGFFGNFHEYVVTIGGNAAKALFVMYSIINAYSMINKRDILPLVMALK